MTARQDSRSSISARRSPSSSPDGCARRGSIARSSPSIKPAQAFADMKPRGVILSGGPESVHEDGSPRAPQAIFEAGVPVLGICYGQMTMADAARRHGRGRASPRIRPRRGRGEERRATCSTACGAPGEHYPVWMSHGDRITKMPPGFQVAGVSPQRALRRHPGREAKILRPDVPPRGDAHAERRGAAAQLRAQDFRRPGRLDHARLQGRGDRHASAPRSARAG